MNVKSTLQSGGYLLAAWLAGVLSIASGQFVDPDLWGRLSVGALYFQGGQFPYFDVFSYTAPHAPWIDHEWLTGLVFYQLLTRFGETGFLIFKYGCILALFGLIFSLHRRVYRASGLWLLYGALLLAEFYAVGLYATVRSQVFSFLGFTGFLYLLETVRTGRNSPRWLWGLSPLLAIWGNLHGGFVMGALLLACYAVGEGFSHRNWQTTLRYLGPGLLGGLALLWLNPYGPKYFAFLWHAWTLHRADIGEWSGLRFLQPQFASLQALVALTALALGWRWLKRERGEAAQLLTPTLVLAWLLVMTCKGLRFQSFLALGLLAYAPWVWSSEFWRRAAPERLQNRGKTVRSMAANTLPALVGLASVAGLVYLQATIGLFHVALGDELTQNAHLPVRYPLGAMNYLAESPYHGNVLVRFGLGEFVYWRLYPRFKVSMDGRYEEVYTQAQAAANHAFFNRQNPVGAMRAIPWADHGAADFILMESNLPNLPALRASRTWAVLYEDPWFVLLGRNRALGTGPAFQPARPVFSVKTFSVGDFIRPATLARFKTGT